MLQSYFGFTFTAVNTSLPCANPLIFKNTFCFLQFFHKYHLLRIFSASIPTFRQILTSSILMRCAMPSGISYFIFSNKKLQARHKKTTRMDHRIGTKSCEQKPIADHESTFRTSRRECKSLFYKH